MLYAAYGSNLHPVRLKQRTPSAKLVGTGVLPERVLHFHKRGFTDGSAKCNLLPSGLASTELAMHPVHLAIYELDPAEVPQLDQAEGLGFGYRKARLPVPGFGLCMTYLAMAEHIDNTLRPFSWYKALVLAGCERLAFPPAYLQAIRTVPTVTDRNRDRHRYHMQLVRSARAEMA